ncbi:glycoside hydrolase family 15 protein [Catenovulum sp. 2E275]|uniref:glycoside hydrolase family 15 protein n=1 Tax=Catenovulum sp. 2E275 TaxID=2980497 RepID=UPI0021D1431B|nr:glycoside hydrolase family 15 protein [Catenovulum sp. 2E275]MCU4676074.1 glycoside hydrolase family 15 protein [Catenovulum sp. 2E275]
MKNTELLNKLYQDIHSIILCRQHPVTGLLPASTAITTHGNYTDAWVRDNVYSILSVWSLGIAYRRHGETERSDELNQATIKLMRGLLQSMMRQSDKVEVFKHTLSAQDALHAKYDTASGLTVVADDAWGHLQIDATSIFLLMLAQMTASGLRIINTFDEVDFIQNLVYYIGFAYRIPDYGIWERGNKINNGKTEINASSVGMAKAALQALDGFNLFGANASQRAVVHTVPDGISRARNTLARLLPRESVSKEVDSALLSIIGFPAFAVGDKNLVQKTRDKILSELGGHYGCKRFLWDGHQTAIEDHSRIHYEHNELTNFANIESEWPLFYTYLYVQALFDKDTQSAKQYRRKIESLMIEKNGQLLIPELYYLNPEHIDAERQNPRSQPRVANENLPLVWAQSLYYLGVMMDEGLVLDDDIDPLKLRQRSSRSNPTQIALVVLAENETIKETLASHGVIAETAKEIAPIKVMAASQLAEAYQQLGSNPALGLTGRPKRRFQSLATAHTYCINQTNYLCLSSLHSEQNNYRLYDGELESDVLLNEIALLNKHWINKEVAVMTYMVTESMCNSANIKPLFNTLKKLQLRNEHSNVGYASATLAQRASRVNKFMLSNFKFSMSVQTKGQLQITPQLLPEQLIEPLASEYNQLMQLGDAALYVQLSQWLNKYGLESNIGSIDPLSFRQLVLDCYHQAVFKEYWLTARWCFSILSMSHSDLTDDLSLLCSRNLTILIGTDNQTVLSGESSNLQQDELVHTIDSVSRNPIERALIQEILVILGYTMRTQLKLFNGIRSIHLNNLLALCTDNEIKQCKTLDGLAEMSPFEFMQHIQSLLESQHQAYNYDVKASFSQQDGNLKDFNRQTYAMDTDWLSWRSERGLITRFDDDFLTAIWQSLSHCPKIVFADKASEQNCLESELIRSSMTSGEESFARLIDNLIQPAHPVYYKAALVEVLAAYIDYCDLNKQVQFNQPIVLGDILAQAADLHTIEQGEDANTQSNLEQLLYQPPQVLQKYIKVILDKTILAQ